MGPEQLPPLPSRSLLQHPGEEPWSLLQKLEDNAEADDSGTEHLSQVCVATTAFV